MGSGGCHTSSGEERHRHEGSDTHKAMDDAGAQVEAGRPVRRWDSGLAHGGHSLDR